MVICHNCEAKNENDARFCMECGKEIESQFEDVEQEKKLQITAQQILFSFEGRINRSIFIKYWLMLTAFSLLGLVIDMASTGEPGAFWTIFGLIQLWPSLAIFVKRWHDRDRSLWLVLLILIPFVGILFLVWIIVELFCLRGTENQNRFGLDPIGTQDFLI